jgi:signal transduction histidine kinase
MSGPPLRWFRLALLLAGLLLGAIAEVVTVRAVADPPYAAVALDAAIGYTYIIAGVIAWSRAPHNRTGPLMMAIGFTWFIGNFRYSAAPVLPDLALVLRDVTNVLLIYLLVAYPSGRLATLLHRVAVAVVGAVLIGPAVLAALAGTPGLTFMAVPTLQDQASLSSLAGAVLAIGVFGLLIRRWLVASRPARRTLTPVMVGGIVTIAAMLSVQLRQLVTVSDGAHELISWTLLVARCLIPVGFLIGLLRLQMARSAVADLVVRLGSMPSPESLRPVLAQALRDPSLDLFPWDPNLDAYVDAVGKPTALPTDKGRAVTLVEGPDRTLAAIVHDPALLEDRRLVTSVAAAVRMSYDNARLAAEVHAQLEEVRASRTRIVAAGDAERKRVERDLHDGAQQRLVSMTLALRLARTQLGEHIDPAALASLDQASTAARDALAELRELAHGIHPQVLTQAGLSAAIESLADRAPVRVDVDVRTDTRFAPAVEQTAYFVVSEALANIAKHANAQTVSVRVAYAADTLTVDVIDDGIGGADPAKGSGLRGLNDRIAAVDGSLVIDSTAGSGTRLRASIPADSLGPTGSPAAAIPA